jgi:uncharacterized membrane protein HdeD (DUF308 family)
MTDYSTHPGRTEPAAESNATPAPAAEPFWQVMALGIVTTLFGLAVLVWPAETVRVLGALVGIWLLVAGAARVIGAFVTNRRVSQQVLSGIVGVIFLIAGLACLRNVARGVFILAFILALTWLLSGVAELVIAFHATGATRTWLIVLALISIGIGLAFALWPNLSLTTTVIMTGISGLIIGVGEIVFAVQMRRILARPEPDRPTG